MTYVIRGLDIWGTPPFEACIDLRTYTVSSFQVTHGTKIFSDFVYNINDNRQQIKRNFNKIWVGYGCVPPKLRFEQILKPGKEVKKAIRNTP